MKFIYTLLATAAVLAQDEAPPADVPTNDAPSTTESAPVITSSTTVATASPTPTILKCPHAGLAPNNTVACRNPDFKMPDGSIFQWCCETGYTCITNSTTADKAHCRLAKSDSASTGLSMMAALGLLVSFVL